MFLITRANKEHFYRPLLNSFGHPITPVSVIIPVLQMRTWKLEHASRLVQHLTPSRTRTQTEHFRLQILCANGF